MNKAIHIAACLLLTVMLTVSPAVAPALAEEPGILGDHFGSFGEFRCDAINGSDTDGRIFSPSTESNNPYLVEIMTWDEATGYPVDAVVADFLEEQNEYFAERIEDLAGSDITCGLSRSDVPDAYVDLRIPPWDEFVSERFYQLRQMDCAIFHLQRSPLLICPQTSGQTQESALACEERERERLQTVRHAMREAVRMSILQLSEMQVAWPAHKRYECLNESLTQYRVVLVDFLEVLAKFPAAFINAAQSACSA